MQSRPAASEVCGPTPPNGRKVGSGRPKGTGTAWRRAAASEVLRTRDQGWSGVSEVVIDLCTEVLPIPSFAASP